MSLPLKIGVAKVGCIGSLPLLEFILDERAERTDIDVRVCGSGANLGMEQCKEVAEEVVSRRPDLIILVGPAQSAPGPKEAQRTLAASGIPSMVISDAPTRKVAKELEGAGLGYIIVNADSMIGARREFLDSTEMALYNSHIIKVLATTGVFRLIVNTLDTLIHSIKKGERPALPRMIIDKEMAVSSANFHNPYAKAKAMAAYEVASKVADLTVEGCFIVKEWERYVPIVASAHEMMRLAARLCDEAMEIEKGEDAVARTPHHPDGTLLFKRRLIEKPSKAEE